jgi:hypothetical protein
MLEARWFRRAGPGIVAIGALLLIASTTTGARPSAWRPADCAGLPRIGAAPIGAWYRLDPRIDDGVRTGQQLAIGVAGSDDIRSLDLDPESFASGPFAGAVLVGTDDGATSRLSLLDVATGCAWSIDRSADVVRHATISPDGTALIEFRVDRQSRADLGVWRRPLAGPGPERRILPPIPADERFGPTWLTELHWSDDGSRLAVQSCGEVACRVRWLDDSTGAIGTVADPTIGEMLVLTSDSLVARGACRGLPCPIRSAALDGGRATTLVDAAGAAVAARDDVGAAALVYELDADGRNLGSMRIDGSSPRRWPAGRSDRRLIAGPGWGGDAAELPAGWVAFGPEGRLPVEGSVRAVLRRLSDGQAVTFDEVPR